ncbi:MAG: hypothetical protein RJB38_1001 [Pseudomonadota bacterium]|jgi:hypothetical protein
MREDYKLQGGLVKITLEVEEGVATTLAEMEKFAKLSQSELANTALKRFIAHHKDFLPPGYKAKYRYQAQ